MNHYPSGFNDLVFRRLFGSPENKDLLIDFLNAIFAHSGSPLIQDVDYLDPYQPSERLESKDSILRFIGKRRARPLPQCGGPARPPYGLRGAQPLLLVQGLQPPAPAFREV
jgi:hypothetical protein